MYKKEVAVAMDEYRDNIARYFNDMKEHFNLSFYDIEEATEGNRRTITYFTQAYRTEFKVSTIEALARPLGATAIDLLLYDHDKDFDRLIRDLEIFKSTKSLK